MQCGRRLRQSLSHPSRPAQAGQRPRLRGDRRFRHRCAPALAESPAATSRLRVAPHRRLGGRTAAAHDRRQHLRGAPHPRLVAWAAPATKTTTGSSPTSSRIATSSTAFRCIRRSAITTPMKPRSATIARRSKTTSTCASASSPKKPAGRASFGPGLFYRFRYGSDIEFVCIDTSKEDFFRGKRLFEYPKHWEFVEQSFPGECAAPVAHSVRAPSAAQRRAAASQHARHGAAAAAVRTIRRAGDVHRPRAQLPAFAGRRSRSLRDGRGRQSAALARPIGFIEAATVSWATDCHFLLAKISGDRMTVLPIGALDDPEATPVEISATARRASRLPVRSDRSHR